MDKVEVSGLTIDILKVLGDTIKEGQYLEALTRLNDFLKKHK
jgi:hypothetical protein